MAKRTPKSEPPPKDPSRVLFLSLNMILLAFFILLVALSQPNKTRETALALEIRKAFQSFGGAYLGLGRQLEQRGVSRDRNPLETTQQIERYLGELATFIEENELAQELSYEITYEGLTLYISDAFAFREGSDQLLETSEPLFRHVYDLVRRTANPVRIEGHTDNRDIRTERLHDGWELSAGRALAVLRYLTRDGVIPPQRFSVVGYGKTRPIASNLSDAGRARNRRVAVTLLGRLRRVGETE